MKIREVKQHAVSHSTVEFPFRETKLILCSFITLSTHCAVVLYSVMYGQTLPQTRKLLLHISMSYDWKDILHVYQIYLGVLASSTYKKIKYFVLWFWKVLIYFFMSVEVRTHSGWVVSEGKRILESFYFLITHHAQQFE